MTTFSALYQVVFKASSLVHTNQSIRRASIDARRSELAKEMVCNHSPSPILHSKDRERKNKQTDDIELGESTQPSSVLLSEDKNVEQKTQELPEDCKNVETFGTIVGETYDPESQEERKAEIFTEI